MKTVRNKNAETIKVLMEEYGQILSNFRDKRVLLPTENKINVMSIGDNLRAIRNRSNISQQEVADYLGVDRKTYVSWEAGAVDIKSSYIPKLAEFLHVEINDLFQEKSRDIVINQHNTNTNNKNNSMNGIIVLLTDKEAVDELVKVMKERFNNPRSA